VMPDRAELRETRQHRFAISLPPPARPPKAHCELQHKNIKAWKTPTEVNAIPGPTGCSACVDINLLLRAAPRYFTSCY
jgi:hypothetical protein